MRSPVQRISFVSVEEDGADEEVEAGVVGEEGDVGLAIQRTVRAAFVWQSSERNGGSTMRRSKEAFRLAVFFFVVVL